MSHKRIYLAGALSNKRLSDPPDRHRTDSTVVVEYLRNVHYMLRWAGRLIKLGFKPYVPALDLLTGLCCGNLEEYEYRSLGLAWLEACEAMFVISLSEGVLVEIKRAEELKIPVFYSLMDLCKHFGMSYSVSSMMESEIL